MKKETENVNYEIEYKYLINKLPFNKEELNEDIKKKYIEQVYFKTNDDKNELIKKKVKLESINNISTFRVRKIKEKSEVYYVLTLKSKGELYREEYECYLNEEEYNYLSEEIESVIIKNRYVKCISYNNKEYTFEFDEYLNLNTDLLTCEVEVDSTDKTLKDNIEYILKNIINIEFEDVTKEKKYKNKYLVENFGLKPIN